MRIDLLSWEKAEPLAAPIRFAIFVEDKQAAGFELDDLDRDCVHAVAYDDAGKAIATARLLPDGQIGRMAVAATARKCARLRHSIRSSPASSRYASCTRAVVSRLCPGLSPRIRRCAMRRSSS